MKKRRRMTHSPFHRRYIAFVDILGFENIVERMKADPRLFDTVRDALKMVDAQAQEFREYRRIKQDKDEKTQHGGRVSLDLDSDLQMTAFSDCYLLSESHQAWHVLAAVQALGSHFLAEGILMRGSVLRGGPITTGRYSSGQALLTPISASAAWLGTHAYSCLTRSLAKSGITMLALVGKSGFLSATTMAPGT